MRALSAAALLASLMAASVRAGERARLSAAVSPPPARLLPQPARPFASSRQNAGAPLTGGSRQFGAKHRQQPLSRLTQLL
jgi:hypothetical protein